MKSILFVGDGPDCPSGFGRATREIVKHLDFRCEGDYEVTVLGINYRGDPSTVPYPVYAAAAGGDWMGVKRLVWMCDLVKPDVVIVQQDGWNVQAYVQQLRQIEEYKNLPVVAVVAVDGKNFQGEWLDGVALAIFWDEFGQKEAHLGGYKGPSTVIPLGVDREVYYPMDKRQAREALGMRSMSEAFIIGNVNRNQPRKRWDLTLKYFAEWTKREDIGDAWLALHVAPTGDTGIHVAQLARYYGVADRIALAQPDTWYGVPESTMRFTYNAFDVQVSTTQGEGFGLTTLEGMACGVPQVVPQWAALGGWAREGTVQVPCTTTTIGPPYVNVIGGVADQQVFINQLNQLYLDEDFRADVSSRALRVASEPRFEWKNIGRQWADVVKGVLEGRWASSSVA